ncbi:DUF4882 family protein [Acinetobacter silvestris]|uniref:DUF4882 domain-containing protein n=1 Tax=Acinetobacter silvestris TaxID=1977882 RepID=A0A1Y3CME5_9GAMM|nr:DUF4882 family protein [Acinetobacter silvestris]OTG67668.1 hypothetical protein B9T28_03370 [Acinetobacter silvestris]
MLDALNLIKVPVTSTSDGYQQIGIYINQNTKQMGVIYNGVNKGYISTHPQKIANLSFEMNMSSYGVEATSPNIGKDLSVDLITDKSKFSFIYPVGTKDICNN